MPKAQLLLVEDDSALAELVRWHFEREEFDVQHTGDGEEALLMAKERTPDLVLLDWMLENLSGIEVCRQLRKADNTANVPIIMLTARGEEDDRIRGLEIGADDYMVKPFGMRELVARIRAVARRAGPADTAPTAATQDIGPLSIDRRTQKVFVNGQDVYLTPKEFGLLAYLATDPGAVYRRNDIMSEVWDTNWYGTTKTVDAHVAALRKKLGNQEWIEAVRGVGFRLGVPDS